MELPPWVSAAVELGPLLTLGAALIAATIAYGSYLHRRKQDRKEEWWRRTQWALDRAPSTDRLVRDLGLDVLFLQAQSNLADKEDHLVIDAVGNRLLRSVEGDVPETDFAAVEYDEDPARSGGEV